MALGLSQTKTALAPKNVASFLGIDGTAPYSYEVLAGGAGGSIDVDGLYTAPSSFNVDPTKTFDTIRVTDADMATYDSKIYVYNALLLFCEIIRKEMGLDVDRVFLWDQKIFQPSDAGMYIAISVPSVRVVGNNYRQLPDGESSENYTNVLATVDLNVISRDNSALFRKEEVLLALQSQYARNQQDANSFFIGKLPAGSNFRDLSGIDGPAIPFRFHISVNVQYTVSKQNSIEFYETFNRTVTVDP